jgi:hypothetical protein
VRFGRRQSAPGAPSPLEFEIAVPEGLGVTRGFAGYDLTISVGRPGEPGATTISVGAVRDGGGPVTLEEHVARSRANAAGTAHLVDEGPAELAGREAWWTIESVGGAQAQVEERWLLVRDGVGWTVNLQIPWMSVGRLRPGALAIVGTLRFLEAV